MRPSLLASVRRYAHTQARRPVSAGPSRRLTAALAGTAVAGAYFTWVASDGQRIALDSSSTQKQVPLATKASDSISSAVQPHTHTPDGSASPPKAKQEALDPESEHAEDAGESESSGGAFNPETGEINWDCPCLGGMAHGPCGLQFREAFSCFVFSEQEPKGIDCIEKFKAMQDCFREHPDVYGEDIMADDDDDDAAPAKEPALDSPPSHAPSTSTPLPGPPATDPATSTSS
ncbi:hypothetical protein GLOTRDRAFT_74323 [Gloeophyllum trabeum ATCC 11539]|uniref:Mitochondrial intermembrane space import and assembly protein 40 n=1 Tax=Gloeophyllum trabeum (strain ATCC 11539 / FP-39264 / Madison 617) TaxID=670483 RepID=S7QC75_GLOTA|nr:uncharacterized protein GLOTRDRAFT_74323 [Gloeophyllum trabeum ATCC 11539]EPQ57491.1 hypothetical protein GLOTRDRAFT_74323 [Gloeophyllum trabeum ATCC 11539]